MDITIGIDLGTTYSCVAYIDADGIPRVIPNTDMLETTASVLWFDGKTAYIGKKANDKKIMPTSPIFEFIKRDIGKPKYINTRYEVNGYYYGAQGLSSIILRKLKKESFNFFKKKGLIPPEAEERSTLIPAVLTVPAYFGDLQRQETRNAGIAAGLNVISIINEPTAAALAYGHTLQENKRIMVFDLGGGTFDVTILQVHRGDGEVIASDGADQLGGKDWDDLIIDFLYSEYRKLSGNDIPDDMGWDIQQKALVAKYDLSDNEQTIVTISSEDGDIEIYLYRTDNQKKTGDDYSDFEMDQDRPFYFDERSENLLSLCRTICSRLIEKSKLSWGDIDEIVLAGGSCRMPMIPNMLEQMTGKKIPRNIPGFNYDTSIAIGAAISSSRICKVQDVTSKTIGIEVQDGGGAYIEHLIHQNKPIPISIAESFKAESNAILKVFEGDSHRPDECRLRGSLELCNPEGNVLVKMVINEDGVLSALVEFPPDIQRKLQIKTDDDDIDLDSLKNKISSIDIRL